MLICITLDLGQLRQTFRHGSAEFVSAFNEVLVLLIRTFTLVVDLALKAILQHQGVQVSWMPS